MSTEAPRAEPGVLYVVATPLGNLQDITLRALNILKSVDLIAAEDTRTTLKLLNHFGLKGPKLVAFYEHNERKRAKELIAALKAQKSVALVSEAGTPAISDPGAYLVSLAHQEGIPVRPVPGPSALACALSVSGFDLKDGFLFLGFLPAKSLARKRLLLTLASEKRPLFFFEAPHRLKEALADLWEVFGDRKVFMAREMTKRHEEYLLTTLRELKERFEKEPPRGEFSFLVEGAKGVEVSEEEIEAALRAAFEEGKSLKEAVSQVAKRWGLSRKKVYHLALKLKPSH